MEEIFIKFIEEGFSITLFFDEAFGKNLKSINSWLLNRKIVVEDIRFMNQNSPLLTKIKHTLGALTYLADNNFEKDYFRRFTLRSKLDIPIDKVIIIREKYFKITTFLAKLIIKLIRNIVVNFLYKSKIDLHTFNLVLVTPGNMINSVEDNLILEAKIQGIPNVICALSFDNLNSKGTTICAPDLYFAWNEHHRSLLINRHQIAPNTIIMSGSLYFERYSLKERNYASNILEIDKFNSNNLSIVLYLGSSANVVKNESDFLKSFLNSFWTEMKNYFLVIRPHPANFSTWADWNEPGTIVYPKNLGLLERENSLTQSVFQNSICAFGINTSAFLDAMSCDTPVFSLLNSTAIFQSNSSHYRFLINSGMAEVANYEDLLGQINRLHFSRDVSSNLKSKVLPNFGNVRNVIYHECLKIID